MIRYFFISIFFVIVIFARDNPFKPLIKLDNTPSLNYKYLNTLKVKFNPDARVIKKIIFVYQTLNSDIKQLEVNVDKQIDFHTPIIISHKVKKYKLIKLNMKFFTLYIRGKKIYIYTNDVLIRKLFLVDPFRIVLDFRRDSNFLTFSRRVKNSIVKKVLVGNHNGYYRVVIYFDARYLFKIKKFKKGVEIELR